MSIKLISSSRFILWSYIFLQIGFKMVINVSSFVGTSLYIISLLWVWCRVELEGFNRIWLELVADPFEFIYGGGEQFSYLNLRNAEHNSNISHFRFKLFYISSFSHTLRASVDFPNLSNMKVLTFYIFSTYFIFKTFPAP